MEIYEKQLEQVIMQHGGTFFPMLKSPIEVFKQVNIGAYGIADIVAINIIDTDPANPVMEVTVFELKRGTITWESVAQVYRYIAGIKQSVPTAYQFPYPVTFKAVVVGKKVDHSLTFPVYYIADHVELFEYRFEVLEGIHFKKVEPVGYASVDSNTLEHLWFRTHNHLDPHAYIE